MGCGDSKPVEQHPKPNALVTGDDIVKYLSYLKPIPGDKPVAMSRSDAQTIADREKQLQIHAKANKNKNREALRGRMIDFEGAFTPPVYPKSDDEREFLDKALGQNFIFSDLTNKEREMLINAMQKQEAKEGEMIIKQGDVGDFFYICEEGTVNFIADGNAVGSCGMGGSFGELALLYDSPRAATCMAGSECVLWKVDQGTFRHLLARTAQEEESNIVEVLAKVDLFKDMDRKTISKFADVLSTVKFKEGERIVEKGQQGDIFYIINEGQVRVHDIGLGDATYEDQILKKGDWFGERALMTGEPRAANVTAMTAVTAFACNRETFETSVGTLEDILGKASKVRFVKSVPIFASSELMPIEYDHLVSMLRVRKYEKGQKLAEAGKVGDNPSLWIVKEGKLMITSKDGNIFFLGSGDYFGDKAVQADGEYVSTATCIVEEDAVCWRLKKSDIEAVIGDIKRLGKPIPFTPKTLDTSITLNDIKKHRLLGMGAFGKVWLATSRDTKDPYALKTISKRQLIDAGQVKGVLREKQIMASIEHPFILPLVGSFQDEESLYLLLPLIQGGELFNVIHTDQRDGLDNDPSQFYGACILEALGHLHARNIVYRDMKPENALIDKDGYCIMVDLGFAKIVVDKTYTLCGTPEYLAPEIIMSKGHDKAVDYWSFGVLIYEMLVGQSPFYLYGTDQVSLFKRIVMVKYQCPPYVSDDAKDVIKQLLTRRQASRLGNLSRGYLDVKEHPWFSTLDFEKLNEKKLKAPWIPQISNPLDARNFDDFSRMEKERDHGKPLSAAEQTQFTGF